MSIDKATKQELVQQYKITTDDTGSVHVQCAIITMRINNLVSHFKMHKKDHHSRRGLILMVEKRRSLLKYLKNKDQNAYLDLIKKLNIRK